MRKLTIPVLILSLLLALSCSEPGEQFGSLQMVLPNFDRMVPGNRPPLTVSEKMVFLRDLADQRLPAAQAVANLEAGSRAQSWTNLTTTGAPAARAGHVAMWSPNMNQMIIFGGFSGTAYLNTQNRFNTSNSTWLTMTATGRPAAREGAARALTSINQVFVWGGTASNTIATTLATGARYTASNNVWLTTNTTGRPAARAFSLAAADSSNRVLVFGGLTTGSAFANSLGYLYNGGTNVWTTINTTNAPTSRIGGAIVWTGTEFIVWGGYDSTNSYVATGARYNPTNNVWSVMNTTNAPTGRTDMVYQWATNRLFVWGGISRSGVTFSFYDDGGLYDVTNDTWTAISNALTNTPTARYDSASVISGNNILVWGGTALVANANSYAADGGLYDVANGTWTPVTATNAPNARGSHSIVLQSATQAIIWGGRDGTNTMNTGAQLTFP